MAVQQPPEPTPANPEDRALGWLHKGGRQLSHSKLEPVARQLEVHLPGGSPASVQPGIWHGVLLSVEPGARVEQAVKIGGVPGSGRVEWICLHKGQLAHPSEKAAIECARLKWYHHSYEEYGL